MSAVICESEKNKSIPYPAIDEASLYVWLESEARAYSRRFAGMLQAKGVFVSSEDREDLASAFTCGALSAFRSGVRDRSLLEKAGREEVYRCREELRHWGKRRQNLSEEMLLDSPAAGRYRFDSTADPYEPDQYSLIVDPNTELHEMLQADILDDILAEYPRGIEQQILIAKRYGVMINNRRRILNDTKLAEYLHLTTEVFEAAANRASCTLLNMMRDAMQQAESHPTGKQ